MLIHTIAHRILLHIFAFLNVKTYKVVGMKIIEKKLKSKIIIQSAVDLTKDSITLY